MPMSRSAVKTNKLASRGRGYKASDSPRRRPRAGARLPIRRAAVLGAGTMGAQIAGLLASNGVPCDLLDVYSEGQPSRLAEEGKKRLESLKPSPVYAAAALELIRPGNLVEHLSRLQDADWVIEAVVEKLDVKRDLWARVAPHLRPDVIASTNTSGISVASIAEALPAKLRRRFLGTHFFNPPRYLRLLELIPTPETTPTVIDAVRRFAEDVLGKGIVVAHDTPSFVANRIGVYGLMVTLKAMEEFGIGPDEVDSITGPAMGRPRSATFRTLDLVGLDVLVDVCDHLRSTVTDESERAAFDVPSYIRELVKRGWTGEKAGQGFFKRVESDGETQILALDTETLEYRPRRQMAATSLAAVRDVEDPGTRVKTLVEAGDTAGRVAWRVLSQGLAYAAWKVGEVTDDIAGIDQAMRWGFGWELGPFELWDALGVATTVRRMLDDGVTVPDWVAELAGHDGPFYRHERKRSFQATPASTYAKHSQGDRTISLRRLRATGTPILQRPGATLFDLGDDVALLDFHSPKQAIGPDMLAMLEAVVRPERPSFRGLVLGSHVQPNFCVGANLFLILLSAQDDDWAAIDETVGRFQRSLLALKRLPVPVVTAPYGLTLGGGAELVLSADRVTAAVESYMGLVEVGAGLIPAGGGAKEMLLRAAEGLGKGAGGHGKGAPPLYLPGADPTPPMLRLFETIGTAKVSGGAAEARELGFLRATDVVVPSLDQLLYVAKQTVLAMDAQGYRPPAPAKVPVLGAGTRAIMELAAQHMVWGGYATEHDLKISRKLAYVLTGGDRPAGSTADEEYFLDLEREAFLSLSGEPKTQARMQHLLKTGRPLRN